jgi:hypothetical protein
MMPEMIPEPTPAIEMDKDKFRKSIEAIRSSCRTAINGGVIDLSKEDAEAIKSLSVADLEKQGWANLTARYFEQTTKNMQVLLDAKQVYDTESAKAEADLKAAKDKYIAAVETATRNLV